MSVVTLQDFSWERMKMAVDAVSERARRISATLREAGIPHAMVGGNAVAAWVARVDLEAVRNTKDVDLLIRREDLENTIEAAEKVGFIHKQVSGIDLFLDGPEGSVRSAVHLIYAGEKVYPDYLVETPLVTDSEPGPEFQIATLDALVRMKLTSFRLKDKLHLLDLLEVGLIDETWQSRVAPELAGRFAEILEEREKQ